MGHYYYAVKVTQHLNSVCLNCLACSTVVPGSANTSFSSTYTLNFLGGSLAAVAVYVFGFHATKQGETREEKAAIFFYNFNLLATKYRTKAYQKQLCFVAKLSEPRQQAFSTPMQYTFPSAFRWPQTLSRDSHSSCSRDPRCLERITNLLSVEVGGQWNSSMADTRA